MTYRPATQLEAATTTTAAAGAPPDGLAPQQPAGSAPQQQLLQPPRDPQHATAQHAAVPRLGSTANYTPQSTSAAAPEQSHRRVQRRGWDVRDSGSPVRSPAPASNVSMAASLDVMLQRVDHVRSSLVPLPFEHPPQHPTSTPILPASSRGREGGFGAASATGVLELQPHQALAARSRLAGRKRYRDLGSSSPDRDSVALSTSRSSSRDRVISSGNSRNAERQPRSCLRDRGGQEAEERGGMHTLGGYRGEATGGISATGAAAAALDAAAAALSGLSRRQQKQQQQLQLEEQEEIVQMAEMRDRALRASEAVRMRSRTGSSRGRQWRFTEEDTSGGGCEDRWEMEG